MKISMVMNGNMGNLASSNLRVCELEAIATKKMIFLYFSLRFLVRKLLDYQMAMGEAMV